MNARLASLWLACAAALTFTSHAQPMPTAVGMASPDTFISPALAETIRMVRAGVDDSVLAAFVKNSPRTLNLGAEQIIFLRDLGASPELLDAMMQHDRLLAGSPAGDLTTAASRSWRSVAAAAVPAPLAEWEPALGCTGLAAQLAPYGQWLNLPDYGWCWRPWIANLRPTWRPYCQGGRWLQSDHGWYWESDFSWGGIVFHYGRWFVHPDFGWCWWPEARWAPAWVTWRTGPDACGWAPLPPGSDLASNGQGLTFFGVPEPWSFDFALAWEDYVLVNWEQFYSEQPARHRLRGEDAADAHLGTYPLNDFFLGANALAVNRGVALSQVMQASGVAVATLPTRTVPRSLTADIEPDRIVVENGIPVILHPVTQRTEEFQMPANAYSGATLSAPVAAGMTPWPVLPAAPLDLPPQPTTVGLAFGDVVIEPEAYSVAEQPRGLEHVRMAYPVKLTDPILVPRPCSAIRANYYIIRMFPN